MSTFSKYFKKDNLETEVSNAQIPNDIAEQKKESDLLIKAMKEVNIWTNVKPFKCLSTYFFLLNRLK